VSEQAPVTEGVTPGLLGQLRARWGKERRALAAEVYWCEMAMMERRVSQRRRELARRHPIVMGRVYFPEWLTRESPPVHFEMVGLVLGHDRVGIAAPVSVAKTTVMTKLTSLWGVLFGEADGHAVNNVAIVTAAQDLSAEFITDMASKVEHSEAFREDFGEVKGSHWGASQMEFRLGKRTAWIRGYGRLGTIRGRRPDWIFLDDPEDEESVKSQKQRDDFADWFWGALVGRLDAVGKKLVYIGTCISEETFLTKVIREPPAGWTVRHYALFDEEKRESLWPDKWPLEEIVKRRAEIGEEKFQQEYQNNPVRHYHQRLFDMSRVPLATWTIEETDYVTVAVDPSFVVGGDEWAVTVIACDRHGEWHEMDAWAQKTGTAGWLEALLNTRKKYPKINVCGIESGSTQSAVEHIVSKWMKEYGVWLPVTYLRHHRAKGSKEQRIARLTGIVNEGRLSVTPGHIEFWRGLERYRAGVEKQEDAYPDSLAMHLELQQARVPTEPIAPTVEEIRHRRIEIMKERRRRMNGAVRPGILAGYG